MATAAIRFLVFCGCSQISAYAIYRMINIMRTQQIQEGPLRQADVGRNGNMDLELENNKGVLARLVLCS